MKIKLDKKKIERLALKKGWTIPQLAKAAGLSSMTLYQGFGGGNSRLSTVSKIADVLETNLMKIITIEE